MTVVEVDGILIIPKNVSSIELSSGQRYSVIIHTKLKVNRVYLIQVSIRWRTLVNGSK
jgi:FtsP/CotA-like multicopper oxidase with cupredoxin domain